MEQIKMEFEQVSNLMPYANNARRHGEEDVDAIIASIKAFGFNDPIGVWKNIIVEGHGRLLAAKRMGLDVVPVVRLDHLTDEQRRAYAIAHNKTAELSEWDFNVLDSELSELSEIDMSQFGFDLSAVEDIADTVEDDFEIDLPEKPKSKKGDIWILGDHKVMCGDATSIEDVRDLTGGAQADLYLTDPPYNVDYTGKTKEALKIQNDVMEDEDFREFLQFSFIAAKQCMKAGAAFYIWHADSEGYNFRGACRDVGWQVRECLIWSKDVFVLGRQDYQWQHEPCLYGWNEGAAHAWYSDRKQTTILQFDRPKRSSEHPTMKPVALFDYLIRNSTKPGDIVLDSFGGSGTTIIACEQNKRKGYCMELDPKYVDVTIERWEKFTGKKAVLQNV